jgi:hypothetical protein
MTLNAIAPVDAGRTQGIYIFAPEASTRSRTQEATLFGTADSQDATSILWSQLLSAADSVASQMALYLRAIASVERVIVLARTWGFEVWVEGLDLSQEQRFEVYDSQWQVMQSWPKSGFDFHLHDRRDGQLSDAVTLEGPRVAVSVQVQSNAR